MMRRAGALVSCRSPRALADPKLWSALAACAVALALVALLSSGCGGSSAKEPGEVVEDFLLAADRGDYEEMETYYTDSLKDQLEQGGGLLFGGTDGLAESYTRGGELEAVEITSQEITDDSRARVEATLIYEGPKADDDYFGFGGPGAEAESVWELVRVEGEGWRLTPSGIA